MEPSEAKLENEINFGFQVLSDDSEIDLPI
jgi:hypothetical protein